MTPGRVATTNRLLAVLDSDEAAAAAVDAPWPPRGSPATPCRCCRATGTPTGSTASTSAGPGPGPAAAVVHPGRPGGRHGRVRGRPPRRPHRAVGAGPRRRGQRPGPARLAGAGAHFMNFFGRFATVDIAPGGAPSCPCRPGCAASPDSAWAKKTSTTPLGDVVEAVGDGAGDEDHAARADRLVPGRPPQPGPASGPGRPRPPGGAPGVVGPRLQHASSPQLSDSRRRNSRYSSPLRAAARPGPPPGRGGRRPRRGTVIERILPGAGRLSGAVSWPAP